VGGEKKKVPRKKPTWAEERRKKKVNLSSAPSLTQGQGETKKVHPSVHHPSTLVHWWVLVHSGPPGGLDLRSGMKHIEEGRMVVE
jgi:hypothetical protein